jgi:hypothetical protein
MGKLCKTSTGDDDVCHMHRRRRMGKGEKLKSRIHQRKPRTRRSPVLVVWIHYHSYRLCLLGCGIMKYKFVVWKVVATADNKDPKNLRLMWELGLECEVCITTHAFHSLFFSE